MKRATRIIAIVLFFATLYLSIPVVSAHNNKSFEVIEQIKLQDFNGEVKYLAGVDMSSLRQDLYEGIMSYQSMIDVSKYRIPATTDNQYALGLYVYDEMPLAFFVDYVLVWRENGFITNVEPRYLYSKDVCLQMVDRYVQQAERYIYDLRDNTDLSDVEKALILHDRIALNCKFDLAKDTGGVPDDVAFNGYGVFVNNKAVCHGYSEAYDYLLELLGIESELCRSNALNHTWNILTINGSRYHVDITWDDSIWGETDWDVIGRLDHRYFLVSTQKLYQSHTALDYDSSPVDTRYDDAVWHNSQTAFQLAGDKLYYIDTVNAKLMCYNDGSVVCGVKDIWYASVDSYWPKNYTCLGSDGKVLYYSHADAIIEYNPETDASKTVYTPKLEEGTFNYIYGFTYIDGFFIYDVNGSPNFGINTMYRETVPYDKEKPKVTVFISNDMSDSQTVDISFSDNVRISGYYFGTADNLSDDDFVAFYDKKITETVNQEGTYYIAATDPCGNVSEVLSLTFYKTVLVCDEANLQPTTVLTEAGKIPSLPILEGSGQFVGWFTTEAEGGKNATGKAIHANQTLYARWLSEGILGDVNNDTLIDNLDAVIVLRYDCGMIDETKSILSCGDVNGDGCVDNLDAALMLKYDAGMIEGF